MDCLLPWDGTVRVGVGRCSRRGGKGEGRCELDPGGVSAHLSLAKGTSCGSRD